MSTKFSVRFISELRNHPLPPKMQFAKQPLESIGHVVLKLFTLVIFYDERFHVEPRLHDDNIPFVPDLAQLDYELRPARWFECGATPAAKFDKLAIKVPQAEFWLVERSQAELDIAKAEMARLDLRRNRYRLLAFQPAVFDELVQLFTGRNEVTLFRLDLAAGQIQFDFNGIWFDTELVLDVF